MRKRWLLVASVAVQGCMSLSVNGLTQNASETFTGTVTGNLNGAGILKLASSKGASCEGNYDSVNYQEGKGVFNCTDGRTGRFDLTFTSSGGTGSTKKKRI